MKNTKPLTMFAEIYIECPFAIKFTFFNKSFYWSNYLIKLNLPLCSFYDSFFFSVAERKHDWNWFAFHVLLWELNLVMHVKRVCNLVWSLFSCFYDCNLCASSSFCITNIIENWCPASAYDISMGIKSCCWILSYSTSRVIQWSVSSSFREA